MFHACISPSISTALGPFPFGPSGLVRHVCPIPAIAFFLEISLSSLRNSLRKQKKSRENQVLFPDITVLKRFLKRRSTFPSNLLVRHLSSYVHGSKYRPLPSFLLIFLEIEKGGVLASILTSIRPLISASIQPSISASTLASI